jgi:hypothetical protein
MDKYHPLQQYLKSQSKHDEVTMTFALVEVIAGPLPRSAWTLPEWWTDPALSWVKAWQRVGWSVQSVDLSGKMVTFAHEPSRQQYLSKRHPVAVTISVAVAAPLIVAGSLGLVHILTPSRVSATTIAAQVSSCIEEHKMNASSDGPVKPPPGVDAPFAGVNGDQYAGWQLGSQHIGGGTIPVDEYESCSWPPAPGADVTGYSRILVSTVNGDRNWESESDPLAIANVLDATCKKMTITYAGFHTGASASGKVTVAAGSLLVTDRYLMSGEVRPQTVSEWAQSVGYYITPGETVILHDPIMSNILNIACVS